MSLRAGALLVLVAVGTLSLGCPPEKPPPPGKKGHGPLQGYAAYDPTTKGEDLIAAAAVRAKAGSKRVLVMFGGNWCKWCRALDGTFQGEAEVKALLDKGFVLVHVDSDTNLPLNDKYGNPFQYGFPVLVVLDADGQKLHIQESGSLEMGDSTVRHHPGKVLAFLQKWAPPTG